MKSDPQIIAMLNDVLTAELTAVNQYWLHGRLCHHWGYERLWEKIRKESIEEMKHADELVDRILYLEGLPNLQRYNKINIGQTVPEMFAIDLATEYDAVKRFNAGIEQVRAAGDNGTREILEKMLREEEEHVDWLETQQEAIRQIGAERYLAEQLKKGES
jgi:bacterioferritin